MKVQRVLVVDNDSLSREFLTEATRSLGYQTEAASNSEEALERAKRGGIDLVLVEMTQPRMDGPELVRELSTMGRWGTVVVITNREYLELATVAIRRGEVADYLVKPCTADTISLAIRRISQMRRLEAENAYLRAELCPDQEDEVVAASLTMLKAVSAAKRYANSKDAVLISGPEGTGKKRLAWGIHTCSPRCQGPFIRVNCAALPTDSVAFEKKLFGHDGWRTANVRVCQPGLLDLADGGTILIEGIERVPLPLQLNILHLLEDDEFQRQGSMSPIGINVRVIATTTSDLRALEHEGRFRKDLYYRLHTLPIEILPLRDRSEDILPLANHFAGFYARQMGVETPTFTVSAERRLRAWHWPGNVEELETVIRRAVLHAGDGYIYPRQLRFDPQSHTEWRPQFVAVTDMGNYFGCISPASPLANRTIADLEREAALCTLEATRGKKGETAKRLGITESTLNHKLSLWRELGLLT